MTIPLADLGLGPGLTDPMNRGEEEILRGGGPAARRRPQRREHVEDAGALRRQPERARQAERPQRSRERDGRGAVLDQRRQPRGVPEVGLMHDPRLAGDARTVDDVVIALLALLLGDEG